MPSTAVIEHNNMGKSPILTEGDILASIAQEFEDACLTYFSNKDIQPENQVHKILRSLHDPSMKAWVSTEHAHLEALKLKDFITKFRSTWLPCHWETDACADVRNCKQGTQTFWDFAITIQRLDKNQAAERSRSTQDERGMNTASFFPLAKLHEQIEGGMDARLLRKCCNDNKANEAYQAFRDNQKPKLDAKLFCTWLEEYQFTQWSKNNHDTNCRNMLTDLGNHPNSFRSSAPAQSASWSDGNRENSSCPPKLTNAERKLLMDNDRCMKCRQSFADVEAAHRTRPYAITAISNGPTGVALTTAISNVIDSMVDAPVIAIVSQSHVPMAYMPANKSNISEASKSDTASDEDDDVSTVSSISPTLSCIPPTPICHPFIASIAAAASSTGVTLNDALGDCGGAH
ncbi:hypothetical protein OE88DRAFT_1649248 [Heliocybe sulcata]|uniref:Uncharacterized protein n=1 Tax=Heliocybe sulcata TaxID=5364 RepID=A0A5C3MJQ0_9AGAM|nr:hypothetical protein OE88DRAFT_1649248 [Heliocybe sulcata]